MIFEDGQTRSVGIEETVSADVVDALREQFARRDQGARERAHMALGELRGRPMTAGGISATLRAASSAYPTLANRWDDPAETFLSLLEYAPTEVPVAASERAYLLAPVRVRRALLALIARRGDVAAVEALGFLLGADGPVGLVPPNPPDGMFDMLLRTSLFVIEPGDPAVGRLVTSLATVIGLPGWTVRVSVFVHRLCRAGRIDEHAASAIGPVAQRIGIELVEACDRGAATTPRLTSEAAMFSGSSDLARRDRARIVPLLALAGEAQHLVGRDPASRFALRALSSADPRVAAMAAVVLVRHGGLVGHDRLSVIALDAHARAELSAGLAGLDRSDLLPARFATARAAAEADMVRWLVESSEIGRAPDEIEWLGSVDDYRDVPLEALRFRYRAPHWAAPRGWMVGASGPYGPDGRSIDDRQRITSSLLRTDENDTVTGHVDDIVSCVLED